MSREAASEDQYQEPPVPWMCFDCSEYGGDYWVRSETWLAAWPSYQAHRIALVRRLYPDAETRRTMGREGRHVLLLCLDCLSRRLGRPLVTSDFDLSMPVNRPIRVGIEMGRVASSGAPTDRGSVGP